MLRIKRELVRVRWAGVLSLLSATACASLLGVEDLKPAEGEGGSSAQGASNQGGLGHGGSSGGRASMGGSQDGGARASGGVANEAGSPDMGGSAGEAGAPVVSNRGGATGRGGASSSGGTPVVGDGGEAGGPSTSGAVHGHVMDFLGHPVSNAVIEIGSAETTTDDKGDFTVDDVAAEYDVSAVFSVPVYGRTEHYAWVYQGLTRRDPTIQVYRGVEIQSSDVVVTDSAGVFDDTHHTRVAVGTPDGWTTFGVSSASYTSSATWYGATTSSGTAHVLAWQSDANDLPVVYDHYLTQPIALSSDSGSKTMLPVQYPSGTITSNSVSGKVTAPSSVTPTKAMYVRFNSSAVITLLQDDAAGSNFSYLAPALANSTITMAAYYGDSFPYGRAYAVAHRDVAPGQTNIDLTLPTPPTLTAPLDGAANVNNSTTFRWVSDAKVFVLHVSNTDTSAGAPFSDLYVVTAKKQLTLPVVAGGSWLTAGQIHSWCVQVHGTWASVDAAANSKGFQDPFGPWQEDPDGTARGDGTLSQSATNGFTAAATQ